jgi:VanZ family protein
VTTSDRSLGHPDLDARKSRSRFLWLWVPVFVYMLGIFFASAMPNPPMPSDVPDVGLHTAAYFGLGLLMIRAMAGGTWTGVTPTVLLLACLATIAYGATDEFHQSFVANRHAELRDLRADAIGAFAAALVIGACGIIRRL